MSRKSQNHFGGLLAISVANLMACRADISPATAPRPELSVRAHEQGSVFSADVDVSISAIKLNEASASESPPPQRMTYHLERWRNARGEWRTSYSDLLLPADRLNGRANPDQRVSRFEIDDAGRITASDGLGNAVDMRFPRIPDSLRPKEVIPREQVSRLQANLAVDASNTGLGHFLLDRPKQRAAIKKLETAGKRIREDGSRTVYELGDGSLRLTADQTLGAIVESERRPGKGPVTRMAYEFTEVSPGLFVRTHTHMEREALDSAPGMSVDTRLTNVVLAREGK